MNWIKTKLKKFWLWIFVVILGGGFALGQTIPEASTIPIDSGKGIIQSERVVDFQQREDYIKFTYVTDVVPPLHEGEDILLRKNNSWTKTTGEDTHGNKLGHIGGEVIKESVIFSGGVWAWDINREDPANWRRLAYATSTIDDFNKTDARTRVLEKRLQGQSSYNSKQSIFSIIFGRYAFATEFFTDSTTEDGESQHSTSASWDVGHDATSGNAAADSPAEIRCRVGIDGPSSTYNFQRCFFYFDTGSTIGASDTITAAILDLFVNDQFNNDTHDQDYYTILQAKGNLISADNTITTADYNQCGDATDNPTKGSNDLDLTTDFTNGQYNTWTMNAAGIAFIARSGEQKPSGGTAGVTYLCSREGHDQEDVPFVGANDTLNSFAFQSNEGTNAPRLTVTHAGAEAENVTQIIQVAF